MKKNEEAGVPPLSASDQITKVGNSQELRAGYCR